MKNEKPKRTEVITFRTTPETKRKLEKISEDKEWSISQVIEKIITEYTKETEKTNITINNNINIERK